VNVAMNRAGRDYVVQFGGAMAAYAVVLIASIVLLQHTQLAAPIRALVAVAPAIPTIFAVFAFVRFLGRMDELQRRIHLEALGFAFGASAILTFAYGLLENAGLPRLSYIWVLPAMALLWGLGAAVASWRYR
jgi:Na+/glutamate symporter